eukprot:8288530-Prorocentrum_lima.AAC.1
MELAEGLKEGPEAQGELTRIGLQDDITFVGSAEKLESCWPGIEAAFARSGHRLRLHKCKA